MNVAPRRPLKTAAWTLRSLLCLSANMILHIHFILSDADLNNFYEALWGRRTKVSQRFFFFSFSLFIFQTVPRKPSCFFFLFVFHFERERERSTREGIMKANGEFAVVAWFSNSGLLWMSCPAELMCTFQSCFWYTGLWLFCYVV